MSQPILSRGSTDIVGVTHSPTDAKSPLVLTAGHRIAHPDLLPLNAANVVSVIRRTRKYASPTGGFIQVIQKESLRHNPSRM